jgi:phosphoribosylaminoimidazole-succinocarboxamide synthase
MASHPWLTPDSPPPPTLVESSLPGIPVLSRGKVREMYDLGDSLLMVASDRVSAFDVVMREPIPGKGIVLNALSEFWFRQTAGLVPNHLLSVEVADFPKRLQSFTEQLAGRSMLVRRAERIDFECVVRGYLAGSAWAEYRKQGTMAGEPLPGGLVESQKLPKPLFTPATKAATGHDENITTARMAETIGSDLTRRLAETSIALYEFGQRLAAERGLILADTKFEFGLLDGKLMLIDELLTPDSSRYWPADTYQPGRPQPSFDKQYLRDHLESTGWNKEPPPPPLPQEVVRVTSEKYREAYLRLTRADRRAVADPPPAATP